MNLVNDLVNKSLKYVAEMHFIGFVDHENIKRYILVGIGFGYIYKLDLMYEHGGHLIFVFVI